MSAKSAQKRHELIISSIHDGIDLECRIVHGNATLEGSEIKGAILGHPYGPMGGSFSDGVLVLLVEQLVAEGYTVGTFNFRGSGKSGGSTSWSTKPEIDDYKSMFGFFIHYLLCKAQDGGSKSPSQPLTICLGGYSYGSLICSKLPDPDILLQAFYGKQAGKTHKELLARASELAGASISPSVTPEQITWQFLMVAPLLSPVSTALGIFAFGRESDPTGPPDTSNLVKYKSLAVFGDQDTFTSGKRLTKWAEKLQQEENSKFEFSMIAGAGHFWREPGAADGLKNAITTWIRS